MKTPREILLERHRTAEPKLNVLRRDILETLSPEESSRSFLAAFLDLVRLPRWAWNGLAAAWLAIIALNIAARERPATQPTPSTFAKRSSETLQALREQKQLFAELVGLRLENSDAEAPRFAPRPRSKRAEATAPV